MEQQAYQPIDRRKVMIDNVTNNARSQVNLECRNNYLKACEAHGGELAEVVKELKTTIFCDLCGSDLKDGYCWNNSCFYVPNK
jgi:hypothetical protein